MAAACIIHKPTRREMTISRTELPLLCAARSALPPVLLRLWHCGLAQVWMTLVLLSSCADQFRRSIGVYDCSRALCDDSGYDALETGQNAVWSISMSLHGVHTIPPRLSPLSLIFLSLSFYCIYQCVCACLVYVGRPSSCMCVCVCVLLDAKVQ